MEDIREDIKEEFDVCVCPIEPLYQMQYVPDDVKKEDNASETFTMEYIKEELPSDDEIKFNPDNSSLLQVDLPVLSLLMDENKHESPVDNTQISSAEIVDNKKNSAANDKEKLPRTKPKILCTCSKKCSKKLCHAGKSNQSCKCKKKKKIVFKCRQCKSVFKNAVALEKHQLCVNLHEKKGVECHERCGKTFAELKCLKCHARGSECALRCRKRCRRYIIAEHHMTLGHVKSDKPKPPKPVKIKSSPILPFDISPRKGIGKKSLFDA